MDSLSTSFRKYCDHIENHHLSYRPKGDISCFNLPIGISLFVRNDSKRLFQRSHLSAQPLINTANKLAGYKKLLIFYHLPPPDGLLPPCPLLAGLPLLAEHPHWESFGAGEGMLLGQLKPPVKADETGAQPAPTEPEQQTS